MFKNKLLGCFLILMIIPFAFATGGGGKEIVRNTKTEA